MTVANNFMLGKTARLYVADSATIVKGDDAHFKKVVNENDIELSYKNDKDSIMTKEKGKITLPEGDASYQLKVTVDQALVDSGFPLLFAALNSELQMQVRDERVNKVIFEGAFTITDMNFKGTDKGVRQFTFTMDNTDVIDMNITDGGRAVTGG